MILGDDGVWLETGELELIRMRDRAGGWDSLLKQIMIESASKEESEQYINTVLSLMYLEATQNGQFTQTERGKGVTFWQNRNVQVVNEVIMSAFEQGTTRGEAAA